MTSRRGRRVFWGLLAAALTVRLAVIGADVAFGVLAQPPIAPHHHTRASALAGAWLDGRFGVPLAELAPQAPRTGDPMRILVAHLLAPLYALASPLTDRPVVGRIAIAIYSLALGPLAYALAREVTNRQPIALATAAITLFWPGVLYRSVVIQREMIVAAATLAVVWVAVRWARGVAGTTPRSAGLSAAVLVGAAALLSGLRIENLIILAAVGAAATTIRYREYTSALAATGATMCAGIALVFYRPVTFIGRRSLNSTTVNEFAHARAHGDTAYLTWLHYDTWLDVVLFAPLKIVYFLGSPLPWSASGVSGVLAGASGLALLAMTAIAVYGTVAALRSPARSVADWRAVAVLVAFLAVGITAYAIIEMNGGAAFRRRIVFVPGLAVFAALGSRHLTQFDIPRSL